MPVVKSGRGEGVAFQAADGASCSSVDLLVYDVVHYFI